MLNLAVTCDQGSNFVRLFGQLDVSIGSHGPNLEQPNEHLNSDSQIDNSNSKILKKILLIKKNL